MIGTKLAHYEITSHLGSGGMGDVYQATDSKLGRSVAIKFLPEAFSHDNERVARFEREARVLASLNHPHIADIYGLEESGDRKFLVMELVEGETLAERIKRRPIPLDESLGIGKQICEALVAFALFHRMQFAKGSSLSEEKHPAAASAKAWVLLKTRRECSFLVVQSECKKYKRGCGRWSRKNPVTVPVM